MCEQEVTRPKSNISLNFFIFRIGFFENYTLNSDFLVSINTKN